MQALQVGRRPRAADAEVEGRAVVVAAPARRELAPDPALLLGHASERGRQARPRPPRGSSARHLPPPRRARSARRDACRSGSTSSGRASRHGRRDPAPLPPGGRTGTARRRGGKPAEAVPAAPRRSPGHPSSRSVRCARRQSGILDDEELLAGEDVADPPRLALRRLDARRGGEAQLELGPHDAERLDLGAPGREVVARVEIRRDRPVVEVDGQADGREEPDEPQSPPAEARAPLPAPARLLLPFACATPPRSPRAARPC